MAVRVFSNNLPDPEQRVAVENVVLEAIGNPRGEWTVQIHENQDSPSWHVTIWGTDNFQWSQEFFGPDQQNDSDGYSFIRRTVSDVFLRRRLAVYISYAFPDNKDGFVTQLTDLLRQELQIQAGEQIPVAWDTSRTGPAGFSKEEDRRVERATILVPVISPSYFNSDACRKEFELFHEKQAPRSKNPQIFPVYFVTAAEFDKASAESKDLWLQILTRYDRFDLREDRFDLRSKRATRIIANLAAAISQSHARRIKTVKTSAGPRPKLTVDLDKPIYIRSLRLKDFRCFDELGLIFDKPSSLDGRWTCIAGINGSGKSSVLQALGVALLGNPLATELGGERLNRMCRAVSQRGRNRAEIDVKIEASGSVEQMNLAINPGGTLPIEPSPNPATLASKIRALAVAGYGATRNVSERTETINKEKTSDVRRQITLFDPSSQLAGADLLLERMPAELAGEIFEELFQKVIRQVFEPELAVSLNNPSRVRFTVYGRDDVEAIDLPDGFRSAAAWIADLCWIWCQKAPGKAANGNPADIFGIVLIDEIDLHLHPSLQRTLVPRLRKTFPKVQFIVTTHSPLVLANFDANEIIALDRDREGNIRELDRQILGWKADDIYEWLMGTRPTGAEFDEQLRRSDKESNGHEDMARLMRTSPEVNGEAAAKQVEEFKEILKSLKR